MNSFEKISNITIIAFNIECFRFNQQIISIIFIKYPTCQSVLFKLIIVLKD